MAASDNDQVEYLDPNDHSDAALEERLDAAAKTGGQRGIPFAWRRAKKEKIVYPPQSPKMWLKTVGWRHVIAIAASIFAIYPVLYIVSSSLSAQDNLAGASLIPKEFSLDSYREFFNPENPNLTPFTTWLRNSWIVAIIAASLNVALDDEHDGRVRREINEAKAPRHADPGLR